MAADPHEQPLLGGLNSGGVVKVTDTVRRSPSSSDRFVEALLLHLEAQQLTTVPRYLGVDANGRQVLSYLPGRIGHLFPDTVWTNFQLGSAARLLRDFHDATASFSLLGEHEVVCHRDFGPWNVVFDGATPRYIIDFGSSSPGLRMHDLSYAAWCWVGLGHHMPDVASQAQRLRVFLNSYGPIDLGDLFPEIEQRQIEVIAEHEAAGRFSRAENCREEQRWLQDHRGELLDTYHLSTDRSSLF